MKREKPHPIKMNMKFFALRNTAVRAVSVSHCPRPAGSESRKSLKRPSAVASYQLQLYSLPHGLL